MSAEAVAVANEILRQIGVGNRMAIGARDPVALPDERGGLRLKVNRRSEYVEVILTAADLYRVSWHRLTPYRAGGPMPRRVILGEAEGVYAEDLGGILYRMTQRAGDPGDYAPAHNAPARAGGAS